MLAEIIGLSRLQLYLNYDRPLSKEELSKYKSILILRLQNTPTQYIFNKAYFMDYELYVDSNVLIPRPDTETLVIKSYEIIDEMIDTYGEIDVVDVGTGSGCITIAIADKYPSLKVYSIDKSKEAIGVAKRNAVKYGLKNIEFINGDIASVDLARIINHPLMLVSNPPYIPLFEMEYLDAEVKKEPYIALEGGEDGLDFYRHIIDRISEIQFPVRFAFEIGYNIKDGINELVSQAGISDIEFTKDIPGIDRVVSGSIGE